MLVGTLPLRGTVRRPRGLLGRPGGVAWASRLIACLALAAAWAPGARVEADEPAPLAPPRWYEIVRSGKKVGWTSVTWSHSTWGGRATVHDRTETVTRTARDMAGHIDVFETRTLIELERDADGSLWLQRIEVREAERVSVETLTWSGSAYVHTSVVDGNELVTTIPLDRPVSADAEAFLSERARAGTLVKGMTFELRELDVQGKRAHLSAIEVLGPEEIEGEAGPVAVTKVVLRHRETRSESWMWLDAQGAFVQTASDTGIVQRRVTEARARRLLGRPPSFSITAPSLPSVERVMSADRLWIEIALEEDAERKLPDLPDSPWGVVGEARRDRLHGWVIPAELRRHDDPDATTRLPIDPTGFEKDLEPTALMPCGHPDLVAAAREAIGGTQDAREAAARLARWVFDELEKQSLEVAQGSALEILEKRRGDCSEHGLLFVALCRAAGIPARRCSGWVNVGPMWGAHAWAEIWVGSWIAADPTTGEIAPAARYLFFGYSDSADSFPGVVSARVDGRISLRALRVEEDGVVLQLDPDDGDHVLTGETPERWFLHPSTGIELRGLPEGWSAQAARGSVVVRGPGLFATIHATADQGQLLETFAGASSTFAGRPALSFGEGAMRNVMLQSRRRILQLQLRVKDEASVAVFERVFAPTVAAVVTAPAAGPAREAAEADYVGMWELDGQATLERQAERSLAGLPDAARERLAPRVARMVARLTADLDVGPDGLFRLLISRPLLEGEVKSTSQGAWRLTEGRLDLRMPAGREGREEGFGTLDGAGRLLLDHDDWALVLRRVPR